MIMHDRFLQIASTLEGSLLLATTDVDELNNYRCVRRCFHWLRILFSFACTSSLPTCDFYFYGVAKLMQRFAKRQNYAGHFVEAWRTSISPEQILNSQPASLVAALTCYYRRLMGAEVEVLRPAARGSISAPPPDIASDAARLLGGALAPP
ncbi:hypothetical protein FN846DRAFT_626819 [Sphaerosporella brunnea]|uniref:Uncharacterized protein n=1 Tax=Sphaerosporella brunnea TaxID=1250544 RepID=A0A5J5EBB7_9PEZI|nr:hypothetical protein FN846DRAFT_626819 [Sphaerosporella brunnea]